MPIRRSRSDFTTEGNITMTRFAAYASEVCFSPSRHTGKERDTESGNDYFGARYYSSSMGRFMSPDWAVKATPVPYAVLDNPQSLNLYSYVQNNPLSRNDPTGHDWFYYNKQWQWQKGHTFYNQDGAVKGLKGYEYLLVFQKTGTSAAGAATGTLTLYDQKSVAFQGNAVSTGFSGGNTPDGYKPPIPNGGYTINLANRGSVTDGYNSPALPAHFDGLQTLHDSSGVDQSGNSWSASYTYEWGNIRAHLDPLQGGLPFDAYLHGKSRTEGGDYTHGCIAERSEVILHMLQGLTVQSLGVDVK
jgi:RHS repeat-associated protein